MPDDRVRGVRFRIRSGGDSLVVSEVPTEASLLRGLMNGLVGGPNGGINLQATLSASSAGSDNNAQPRPHHPITCTSQLLLHEDGRFECEHAEVPPEDQRTTYCIQHSIALLIIECAAAEFG